MPVNLATSGIVAQAFRLLELTPVSSLEDDTEKAQAAMDQYGEALKESLEAADWSFASTLVNLPEAVLPLNVAADTSLPHSYTLPGDCLRLHEVGVDLTAWRVDRGGLLRADEAAPLRIRYTALVESEAAFPATFRTLVALSLALRLAPRWSPASTRIQALQAQHSDQMQACLKRDARTASDQRYDDLMQVSDWVTEALR